MYRIIVSLLMLLAIASVSNAQNKISVKGSIADSLTKTPLEFATVAIVNAKDTSLISYTLTDKAGTFKLTGIPVNKPSKLIISYIGYNTFRQVLQLSPGETKDLGQIFLSGKSLNEVVIKGERSPVVIKKDTVEFNTEAFKTRPNAVVEELLRKLPGVQVNADGSILFNGKSINKLLIDGKRFFGDDPKVATRNLDADMVNKIQVYDDREDDPDHKLPETEVGKIINLKLKSKIKKSTLGKIYAGGGSRDRYEAAGILSNFRDTLQISIIGMANNLTKTGFSQSELYNMGGFSRSGGDQIWDGTFGSNGWGGMQNGMENVASGGLNINNDYGKKLKMNLLYFYTRTNRINNQKNINEQTLGDTTIFGNSSQTADQTDNKHVIGGLIEWNPDTLNRLRYAPNVNISNNNSLSSSSGNQYNNFNPRISESLNRNSAQFSNNTFSHTFSYYRRSKKKGESVSVNHNLNLNKNTTGEFSYNDLTSYTSDLRSEILDRYEDHSTRSNSGGATINYTFPIIKDITGEINSGSQYSSNTDLLFTYNKDSQSGSYDQLLTDQSNELNRSVFTQSIKPQLNYNISKKYTVKLGLSAEFQDVKNKFNATVSDINQKYYNFFPAVQFSGPGVSFNFNQHLELPAISAMQPVLRVYSQLYRSIGNPGLKASLVSQFSGNIYKYNYNKQLNFNAYTFITLLENNVVNKRTIDGNGATTTTYVSRKGGTRVSMGGSIGKQFKKSQHWQIGLKTDISGYFNKAAFFLNADEGIQYNYSFRAAEGINFNYDELLSINAKYDFSTSITDYKQVNYRAVNTYTHGLSADFSLRWPKKIILDGKYSYNYNPQVAQGYPKSANILNLAVTLLMLKKDRGQLKFSVYDLFDQNISVYRYAYGNAVTAGDQEILKRYFLLTYQYKLSVFKK